MTTIIICLEHYQKPREALEIVLKSLKIRFHERIIFINYRKYRSNWRISRCIHWSVKSNQFEDQEGSAMKILFEKEIKK